MLLPTAYLDTRIEDTGRPTVELGWASTVHSAQGRTVDQAIMVVDENTDAEALHVGMSRGHTSNVAEAGDDTENLADLIRAAVQSPTASEVVLDAGPHPADTTEAGSRRRATRTRRPSSGNGSRRNGNRSPPPSRRRRLQADRRAIDKTEQQLRRRALTLESARLIPAGPHTDKAQQRIVETWEISPEAAPVLGRYQKLEEARLQQPDQAPQRQDRADPEIGI